MSRIVSIMGATFCYHADSEGIARISEAWIQSRMELSPDGRFAGSTEEKWYRVEMVDGSYIDINPQHIHTINKEDVAMPTEGDSDQPLESTRESA